MRKMFNLLWEISQLSINQIKQTTLLLNMLIPAGIYLQIFYRILYLDENRRKNSGYTLRQYYYECAENEPDTYIKSRAYWKSSNLTGECRTDFIPCSLSYEKLYQLSADT